MTEAGSELADMSTNNWELNPYIFYELLINFIIATFETMRGILYMWNFCRKSQNIKFKFCFFIQNIQIF